MGLFWCILAGLFLNLSMGCLMSIPAIIQKCVRRNNNGQQDITSNASTEVFNVTVSKKNVNKKYLKNISRFYILTGDNFFLKREIIIIIYIMIRQKRRRFFYFFHIWCIFYLKSFFVIYEDEANSTFYYYPCVAWDLSRWYRERIIQQCYLHMVHCFL